jgi:hypothetical protein
MDPQSTAVLHKEDANNVWLYLLPDTAHQAS